MLKKRYQKPSVNTYGGSNNIIPLAALSTTAASMVGSAVGVGLGLLFGPDKKISPRDGNSLQQ